MSDDLRRQAPSSGLQAPAPSPQSPAPSPCYACIFLPSVAGSPAPEAGLLLEIAQAFSPRYERHHDGLVSIDVTGLERFMRSRGAPLDSCRPPVHLCTSAPVNLSRYTIGEELVRVVAEKGVRAHVAIAGTRVAALVLAHARPGLTIIAAGDEAAALAAVPIAVLAQVTDCIVPPRQSSTRRGEAVGVATFTQWALRTLGELAALPAPDLMARLGRQALVWQAIARGEDVRPLVPTEPDERFAGSLELEWPIEGLEPLSFVLTRLLEPLSTQLERRDRGAAVLHVTLDLVTHDVHARHLQLPSPIRDVRALRTLALLDIEAHPPAGAIDRITVVIDPTPGRIVQHTLFTRTVPTPERLSTLLARLGAVMGQDRVGAPAPVDTHRPGAFVMRPFATEQAPGSGLRASGSGLQAPAPSLQAVSALRRCRHPIPARVVINAGRPVRVTSDRRGFAGGSVKTVTGPWRTSGNWWDVDGDAGRAGGAGRAGQAGTDATLPSVAGSSRLPSPPCPPRQPTSPWDRTEWDVALSDGATYRVFHDGLTDAWFIEGMFD